MSLMWVHKFQVCHVMSYRVSHLERLRLHVLPVAEHDRVLRAPGHDQVPRDWVESPQVTLIGVKGGERCMTAIVTEAKHPEQKKAGEPGEARNSM